MPDANVRVICRFRPANERERRENVNAKEAEGLSLEVVDSHTVQVVGPGSKEVLSFKFDHVFGETAAQRQVYEITARETVKDMLDGYNGTIFAYGQTGAGKTYTMTSNLSAATGGKEAETRGIVPRACSQLFAHIEQDNSGTEYTIKCSFLEIYKEALHDLLAPEIKSSNLNAPPPKLKIRETPAKGVWVEGLTEAFVTCESEIFSLLQLGEQSRSVASTNMNAVSSRSHTLFVITLVQKLKDGSTKSSRLNLADLAGSEKVGKTGATGETLEEAKKINQSLSALGNCIVALTKAPEKRKHVPYRDSKLTFILRESLGGNSKTTLLIACSPHLYNLEETISTLRFGQRAKSIKNQVKINAHRSVAELEIIVTKLQAEVSRLRAYSKTLEQELITRLPGETIDLQALQEKAWKTIPKSDSSSSSAAPSDPPRSASASTARPTLANNLSVPSQAASNGTSTANGSIRSKRALSGSNDSSSVALAMPLARARPRSDSDHGETFSSPSPSLSFLSTESVSDGTRTPPDSEDSDFWTPMNLVEAQLAYDRMKEELEFKLQDALEELAQARDENGIEQHKAQLTLEFQAYKASNDAKLAEVQALSTEMMAKIACAAEQAESLAEQLNVVCEEKDALLLENQALQAKLTQLQVHHDHTLDEATKISAETMKSAETEKRRLEVALDEQSDLAKTHAQHLEEASQMVSKLTSDLNEARESKTALKTQLAARDLEIESLRAGLAHKDAQILEASTNTSKLEIRLQEYIGRVEEQGKATGEGLKMLGDLNKTLTEKNQQLFEEKNGLVAKNSEAQLRLDIAQNELESVKKMRSEDISRNSALEADLSSVRSELEQFKLTAMKRAQALELDVKTLEKAVVEEERATLAAQLLVERARVETATAHTEVVCVRAELERELAKVRYEWADDAKTRETALAAQTRLCETQASELAVQATQLAALQREAETAAKHAKRIEALEEDLTDARVALRRAKADLDALKDEKEALMQELAAAHVSPVLTPATPAKSSVIGRDPTANTMIMDSHFAPKTAGPNSRISVPVSYSLTTGGAAGLLLGAKSATSATSTLKQPTSAARFLSTPSAANDRTELSAWFQVCTCIGKTEFSSGWRKLWVVAKERKVTCYEAQDMKNIVEAVQVRGCHLLQLPTTDDTLVEQPTEHCFVLISNHDDAAIESQDEYAFCAQSPEVLNQFVQYFLRVDCEMLAFSQLRLESAAPLPPVTSPSSKSAFSKLGQPSGASPSTQSTPARSFLSGLFGKS
jgi:kinesin family protein 5